MKLSADHSTDWDEALLREAARGVLGAQRISADYLAALRIVLGNLARADRTGAELELNTRVAFATERTMRTLLDQLNATGITTPQRKGLGAGRVQTVSVYRGDRASTLRDPIALYRRQEARDDKARDLALTTRAGQAVAAMFNARQDALGIADQDVAY